MHIYEPLISQSLRALQVLIKAQSPWSLEQILINLILQRLRLPPPPTSWMSAELQPWELGWQELPCLRVAGWTRLWAPDDFVTLNVQTGLDQADPQLPLVTTQKGFLSFWLF